MKLKIYFGIIAMFMAVLVVSLPVCFAAELNLIYDGNGNLVTGDGLYREYNGFNQLSKIYNGNSASGTLLQEYIHDPVEERILAKKTFYANGSVRETVYYFDKEFVIVVNESGRFNYTYIYLEGQLVAQLNPDGTKIFIHPDNIGSTSVVTNSTGNVIENTAYSPFGEVVSGGTKTRYGYEAKEHDSVVGDTDFHFRKYKPEWGIFTQPDTLIQNVYDPQTLNRYAFERNNPYNRVDETGHMAPLLAAMLAGAVVGAIAGGSFYLGSHLISGEEMTWKGMGSYSLGGAVAGAIAPVGLFAFGSGAGAGAVMGAGVTSSAGSAIGQMAMNYGDEKPLMQGVGSAAVIGGLTGGIAQKALPMSRYWLIKNPLSYVSTATGNRFISNLFSGMMAANLLTGVSQSQTNNAKTTQNGGGSSTSSGGSGGFWSDVRQGVYDVVWGNVKVTSQPSDSDKSSS